MSGAAIDWPGAFADIRERLDADLARLHGDPAALVVPIEYQHRPYSHVVRVEVRTSDAADVLGRVFVKRFKPKPDLSDEAMRTRVAHEYETTSRAYTALADRDELGVIRPLLFYADTLTIVTEEANGITMLELLRRRAGWWPSRATMDELSATLARTGRWLAAFQAVDAPAGGQVRLDDLRAYIDVRLAKLIAARRARFADADRTTLLRHIDRLGAAIDAADLGAVLVHADLAPGNVLVDGRRVVVLDFAMAHHGTRLQDLTRLHMQLDLLCGKPQYRPATMSRLQAALRAGFDPALTAAHPLYRLQLVLHHVNHFSTLSLRPSHGLASLYDGHLRRWHRRWLARECSTPVAPGAAA